MKRLLLLAPATFLAAGAALSAVPPSSCSDPRCERPGSLGAALDQETGAALEVCECEGEWFALIVVVARDPLPAPTLQAYLRLRIGRTEEWVTTCETSAAPDDAPDGFIIGIVDIRDCEEDQTPVAAWLVDSSRLDFRPLDVSTTTCWIRVPEFWTCDDYINCRLGCVGES